MSRIRQVKERWQTLQVRERRIVIGGAVALALILFYFFAIDPWRATERKLDQDLPRLRADLVRMQVWARQARQIKSVKVATEPGELVQELRKNLEQFNLPPDAVNIDAALKGRIHLKLSSAEFNATLIWLEKIQKEQHLRVVSAKFSKSAEVGKVNADLLLALPGGDITQ